MQGDLLSSAYSDEKLLNNALQEYKRSRFIPDYHQSLVRKSDRDAVDRVITVELCDLRWAIVVSRHRGLRQAAGLDELGWAAIRCAIGW